MTSLMNLKAPAIAELAATTGAAFPLMGASRAARGQPLRPGPPLRGIEAPGSGSGPELGLPGPVDAVRSVGGG